MFMSPVHVHVQSRKVSIFPTVIPFRHFAVLMLFMFAVKKHPVENLPFIDAQQEKQ